MGSECQQVWALLDGVSADEAVELKRAAKTPNVAVVNSTPDLRTWLCSTSPNSLSDRRRLPSTPGLRTSATTFAGPVRSYEGSLVGRYELAKSRAINTTSQETRRTPTFLCSVLTSLEKFDGKPRAGLV